VTLPSPEAIAQLARSTAQPLGLEVRGVQLLAHRIPMTVQVLVQCSDGSDVSLDQCAGLSGPLGEALEASELLLQAYVLEISSPGIGEELFSDRDFNSFRGFPVRVQRRRDDGSEQAAEGLLLGRDDTAVLLNVRGRTQRIPRDAVLRVLLVQPHDDS